VGVAGDVILRRALPLFLALAAFATAPTHAKSCASEAESRTALETAATPAKAALARLEALRKSTYEVPSFSGEYGFVSFLALQSRQAKDERLRQLFARVAHDQFVRLAWINLRLRKGWAEGVESEAARVIDPFILAEMCRVDTENQAWLKADLKQHGWYKKSVAGELADNAAWLLVQHSAEDQPFQREILALLDPLLAQGDTAKSNYALLFDRVAYYSGRPQRYGSQGTCSAPHTWSPFPIGEPTSVDKRRSEVDLPPLAEEIARNSASCP
jgi:hypothetical protein